MKGRGGEGREEKERVAHNPPLPRRASSRRREDHLAREGEEATEQEPEGAEEGGGKDGETPRGAPGEVTRVGGDGTPPRGKRGPPGIHPRTCAPVVAESLWRLTASQRRVAPGWGNWRRRCMEASLAPDRCAISEMVRLALWSDGAPLHFDPSVTMAGGNLTELEL